MSIHLFGRDESFFVSSNQKKGAMLFSIAPFFNILNRYIIPLYND